MPPSFRRFLLSRMLLLMLPILGLSGWLAYAKANNVLRSVPTQVPLASGQANRAGEGFGGLLHAPSHQSNSSHQPQYLLVETVRAEAALRELAWVIGGTTALVMGTVTALSIYLARELAKPGEELQAQMLQVHQRLDQVSLAEGLEMLPSESFKVQEFRQLARTFNELMERLARRTDELGMASREAQAACEMKSQFLAATSHELRTPLNSLIGHIHLIQDDCCDSREEEMECLAQANQAALHLLHVMNELLDIARIEAGEFELTLERVNFLESLQEVFQLQRPSLEQKELALELGLPGLPVWMMGDRNKLRQVLLNVVQNAIKFTDRGKISVTLQLLPAPSTGQPRQLLLSVTDSGIGIEPKMQQQLFQPFSRVGNTASRTFEGTGLGLVISRSILERMGGDIQISSPGLGLGTRVEIRLAILDETISPVSHPARFAAPPDRAL